MSAGALVLNFLAVCVTAVVAYYLGHRRGMQFFFNYRNDVAAKHGRLLREAKSAHFVEDTAWLGKGRLAPTPEEALRMERTKIRVVALEDATRTLAVEGQGKQHPLAFAAIVAEERWGHYDRETGLWEREDGTMTTPQDCEGTP